MKLTGIIPTLNEEKHIKICIDSIIDFVDELIVIDSFSTDKTLEIIANYPKIKLIKREFDNYSSQKNFAIKKASNDWIFLLDADEIATKELKKEITELFKKPFLEKSFQIKRRNFFLGKEINYSGWQNDKVIRLFDKNNCKYTGIVHETIFTNSRNGKLQSKIDHYPADNLLHFHTKQQKYADIKAQLFVETNKKISAFHLFVKPFYRFIHSYIIQLGFLDGKRGFLICAIESHAVSSRYIKALLLKYKNINYEN